MIIAVVKEVDFIRFLSIFICVVVVFVVINGVVEFHDSFEVFTIGDLVRCTRDVVEFSSTFVVMFMLSILSVRFNLLLGVAVVVKIEPWTDLMVKFNRSMNGVDAAVVVRFTLSLSDVVSFNLLFAIENVEFSLSVLVITVVEIIVIFRGFVEFDLKGFCVDAVEFMFLILLFSSELVKFESINEIFFVEKGVVIVELTLI